MITPRSRAGLLLTVPVLSVIACGAQSLPRSTALRVAGLAGEAPVVQVNGHSYVDVEALTRILHGTLGFEGSRIVLDLSGQSSGSGAASTPSVSTSTQASTVPSATGLSREFVTAAVGALSVMREWSTTLVSAVERNQPVTEDLLGPLHRRADAQLTLALDAARNEHDHSASALLQNENNNLRTLSANYIGLHDSATNIPPNALDEDALNAKVLHCMTALGNLRPGDPFQDISVCH